MCRTARALSVVLVALTGAEAFLATGARLRGVSARPDCARRQHGPRMQMQQDEWLSATDEASGSEYWYNPSTGETSWQKPAGEQRAKGLALPEGARLGQLLPVSDAQKKNSFKGGREGLMQSMNPIKPGTVWYKEPSLILFFGWQPVVALYAVFFGFHNQYTGDFGPFVAFKDGALDFSLAAKEWARLHTASGS